MKRVVYFAPNPSSFINRDLEILSQRYLVKFFSLNQGNKYLLPFQLLRQFFQCIFFIPFSNVVICHFAGYSSVLPIVIGKIFSKKRYVIVAGTDAASFPKIDYGNFRSSGALNFCTGFSLSNCTKILPVHESLALQKYDYHEYGKPFQGFHFFCPKTKRIPLESFYYSYDNKMFKILEESKRVPLSFISVGSMAVKSTYYRKGFDLIIEFAKLHPEYHFTLIGWDNKVSINATQNVRLLPFLPQSELVKEFNSHRYYLQLSLMEGFPNALAESMLCGCVPIGSNVSGIPYIIGKTGYVLNKHNLNELVKLVDTAINDQLIEDRSMQCRERVVSLFNDNRKLEILQKLID